MLTFGPSEYVLILKWHKKVKSYIALSNIWILAFLSTGVNTYKSYKSYDPSLPSTHSRILSHPSTDPPIHSSIHEPKICILRRSAPHTGDITHGNNGKQDNLTNTRGGSRKLIEGGGGGGIYVQASHNKLTQLIRIFRTFLGKMLGHFRTHLRPSNFEMRDFPYKSKQLSLCYYMKTFH